MWWNLSFWWDINPCWLITFWTSIKQPLRWADWHRVEANKAQLNLLVSCQNVVPIVTGHPPVDRARPIGSHNSLSVMVWEMVVVGFEPGTTGLSSIGKLSLLLWMDAGLFIKQVLKVRFKNYIVITHLVQPPDRCHSCDSTKRYLVSQWAPAFIEIWVSCHESIYACHSHSTHAIQGDSPLCTKHRSAFTYNNS